MTPVRGVQKYLRGAAWLILLLADTGGAIMIGGQTIQVGLVHARKTAEVTVEADTYQITVEPGITITAPRTISRANLLRASRPGG